MCLFFCEGTPIVWMREIKNDNSQRVNLIIIEGEEIQRKIGFMEYNKT